MYGLSKWEIIQKLKCYYFTEDQAQLVNIGKLQTPIFPNAGIQYFYYDQLGSGKSENPNDERLWNVDRFVDEVEQVKALIRCF